MTGKTVAERVRIKPGTTIAVLNRVPGIVESLGLPGDVTFVGPADASKTCPPRGKRGEPS